MKIYKRSDSGIMPVYATEHAAGFDIASIEDCCIKPFQRHLVSTGLYFEIEHGYELQIRPRSGLAAKHGVTVLNTPGTIDSDYRGEIKIILINFGDSDFLIKKGDRIAQGVVHRVEIAEFEDVSVLSDTSRGNGGFGHTGV